jgi:hypothetical protein
MATQTHPSAPTGTLIDERNPYRFAIAAMLIGFVLILAAAIGLFQLVSQPATDASVQAAQGDVVDGWMPAISAANRAAALEAANRTQDGWSSALLKPEQPAVDGWSVYLLRPEPEVVDGWSVRYLVSDD